MLSMFYLYFYLFIYLFICLFNFRVILGFFVCLKDVVSGPLDAGVQEALLRIYCSRKAQLCY